MPSRLAIYHDLRVKGVKGVQKKHPKVKMSFAKRAAKKLRDVPHQKQSSIEKEDPENVEPIIEPNATENNESKTTAQKATDLAKDEMEFRVLYWSHLLADTYAMQFKTCKALEKDLGTLSGISPLVNQLRGKIECMREHVPGAGLDVPGGLIKGGDFLRAFYKQFLEGNSVTLDKFDIIYKEQPLEVSFVCVVYRFECIILVSS